MADSKNSFVVYTGIKETLDELSDEQVAKLFRGMVDYQITGKDPEFTGMLKFAFIPIRQQMDRDTSKWERTRERRAEAGRKGGIASGESRRAALEANEANALQTKQNEANEANEAVNVNVNVNDNVNVDVNVDVSDSLGAESDVSALSHSLIDYLNNKTGSKYKLTEATTERIGELLSAGYTEADFKSVINSKVSDWLNDPKMSQYLRPRTLFGDKFEEYVSAPESVEVKQQKQQGERKQELIEKRAKSAENLEEINQRLEVLRGKPGGVKAHWDEWETLRTQQAIIEQTIEGIDKRLERMEASE